MATKKLSSSVSKLKSRALSLKKNKSNSDNPVILGAVIAEVIGTFLFAATAVVTQGTPIFMAFALVGIALLVGTISGAHLNPAISLAAWLTKKISGLRALAYIIAQFAGAILAFTVLNYFIKGAAQPSQEAMSYGQVAQSLFKAQPIAADKEWYLIFAEIMGALILGFAISMALSVKKDRVASSMTMGFGLLVALLLAGTAANYVGGTAILNPALAASLDALKWDAWPIGVYVVAPALGALVGFFVADILRKNSDGGSDK